MKRHYSEELRQRRGHRARNRSTTPSALERIASLTSRLEAWDVELARLFKVLGSLLRRPIPAILALAAVLLALLYLLAVVPSVPQLMGG